MIYPSTNIGSNSNVKLFIKHCYIRNKNNSNKIENKSENSIIPLDQLSVAIGLIFLHQLHCIEIRIHKLIVTNTTSVIGPLFSFSTYSTKVYTLNLTLTGCNFANNKNNLYPLILYIVYLMLQQVIKQF